MKILRWILLLNAPVCASGAITSASVTPSSLVAGTTGSATVTFVNGIDVPVGGVIAVFFPAGFYVATGAITITSGVHSSSTVASTPAMSVATVTIATSASVAGSSIAFAIDGISNPGTLHN